MRNSESLLIAIVLLGALAIVSGEITSKELCASYKRGIVPPTIKPAYDQARGGLSCIPSCRTTSDEYFLRLTCDGQDVDAGYKEQVCIHGHHALVQTAKRLGCHEYDCFTNDDGDLIYRINCERS